MEMTKPALSDIFALRDLWREAFGDADEFLDGFFDNAFSPERCRCVKLKGKIVAALYIFDCEYEGQTLAYIYAVATLKEYRGQGLCRTLTEKTLDELKGLGYCGALLVPASKGLFVFYEKLGFHTCCFIDKFECTASKNKTEVHSIDKDEYAALRRRYLPKNGVLQENENLDFLALQAELFKGDGFIFACRRENGTLFGIELLGNIDKSAEILSTLGCDKGVFRTVGNSVPFAMYCALNDLPAPDYFGLAFD